MYGIEWRVYWTLDVHVIQKEGYIEGEIIYYYAYDQHLKLIIYVLCEFRKKILVNRDRPGNWELEGGKIIYV